MKNNENIKNSRVDYSEYLKDIHWEYCDFHEFPLFLRYTIANVLCEYGQCDEQTFLLRNLKDKFPDITKEDLDKYSENIDDLNVGEKDRTNYFLFNDPRHAFKLIESMRFRKLKKQYENDPNIFNLRDILYDLHKIVDEGGSEFILEEKIEIVKRALNARGPEGSVFDLTPQKD
jgi:hypothetical protein